MEELSDDVFTALLAEAENDCVLPDMKFTSVDMTPIHTRANLSLADTLQAFGVLRPYVDSTLGHPGSVVCLLPALARPEVRALRDVLSALGRVAHGGRGGAMLDTLPFERVGGSLESTVEPVSRWTVYRATFKLIDSHIIMMPILLTASGTTAWVCVFPDMAYPTTTRTSTATFGTILNSEMPALLRHASPKRWLVAESMFVPNSVATNRLVSNNVIYRIIQQAHPWILPATIVSFFQDKYHEVPVPATSACLQDMLCV